MKLPYVDADGNELGLDVCVGGGSPELTEAIRDAGSDVWASGVPDLVIGLETDVRDTVVDLEESVDCPAEPPLPFSD